MSRHRNIQTRLAGALAVVAGLDVGLSGCGGSGPSNNAYADLQQQSLSCGKTAESGPLWAATGRIFNSSSVDTDYDITAAFKSSDGKTTYAIGSTSQAEVAPGGSRSFTVIAMNDVKANHDPPSSGVTCRVTSVHRSTSDFQMSAGPSTTAASTCTVVLQAGGHGGNFLTIDYQDPLTGEAPQMDGVQESDGTWSKTFQDVSTGAAFTVSSVNDTTLDAPLDRDFGTNSAGGSVFATITQNGAVVATQTAAGSKPATSKFTATCS